MGTTVTTNLGLIKPDEDESIKENLPTFAGWADQNADNCDVLDALFRTTEHNWTPTWTGTGSNPAVGTGGFVTGKYMRCFPRMVIGEFRIFMGTASFTVGSGSYNLSMPVAIASELDGFANEVPIGKAIYYDDSSVLDSHVLGVFYAPATDNIFLRPPIGGSWGAANPIVPAVNDRVCGYFMYPTSAA